MIGDGARPCHGSKRQEVDALHASQGDRVAKLQPIGIKVQIGLKIQHLVALAHQSMQNVII
jgi:hypothetical protein